MLVNFNQILIFYIEKNIYRTIRVKKNQIFVNTSHFTMYIIIDRVLSIRKQSSSPLSYHQRIVFAVTQTKTTTNFLCQPSPVCVVLCLEFHLASLDIKLSTSSTADKQLKYSIRILDSTLRKQYQFQVFIPVHGSIPGNTI